MKKYENELKFIKPHLIDFDESIDEIMILKVLSYKKLNFVRGKLPYILFFVPDDIIQYKSGVKESHLIFYYIGIKSNKQILLGISVRYLSDGTKVEKREYLENISRFMSWMIRPKHNIIK